MANADPVTGTFSGFAGEAPLTGPGAPGLVVVDGFVTSTTGQTRAESAGSAYRSIVTAGGGRVRVTHDYRPSASPNLYEIVVAIENIGATPIGDLRYRRVMDWDVQPFAFDEWGEIHVGTAPNLLRATTDGFQSANPLDSASPPFAGLPPSAGSPPTTLVPGSLDYFGGPSDQGALFDFAFGALAPGQTKTFVMYYGAAASRAEALAAITQVGASAYSLGIPRTSTADPAASPTGPNVFIFAYGPNPVVAPPTLAGSAFFGGSGDQRGTGISVRDGAIYASGIVQPQTQSPSDTALVLKYSTPLGASPAWSRTVGSGTNFFGIAATTEGVYTTGWNYSLTTDGVGGKEAKSFAAKFAPDGSAGPAVHGSLWATGGPGTLGAFFAYTGVESFYGATTALEGGSTFVYAVGGGQPASYCAYLLAKYGSAGTFVAAATDSTVGIIFGLQFIPSTGCSNASGVTVLNGNVFLAGMSGWSHEGDADGRPALWKYDPSLALLGRFKDASVTGSFNGVTALGDALYAVGFTHNPLVSNSEDFLIQKYSEAGALLWSKTSGGASTDVLTGVVAVGSRLFAVGYTRSQGAGGEDAVLLEIDPDTGTTLSTTLFGGAQDDRASGVATDGTDLYVVGESRSFASAAGNVVGGNDVML
ncbi:MAG TPA: hypothetical protein VI854_02240, partial [Acidimicrobiia bacterium]|nr:hypothetical protein [Acidimicrobiia bacterium]